MCMLCGCVLCAEHVNISMYFVLHCHLIGTSNSSSY